MDAALEPGSPKINYLSCFQYDIFVAEQFFYRRQLSMVMRFLLQHALSTGQKIEEIRARRGMVETRQDTLEGVRFEIDLRRNIAEAMREVLREKK